MWEMVGIGVIFLNLLLMMSCMMGMYLSNRTVRLPTTSTGYLTINYLYIQFTLHCGVLPPLYPAGDEGVPAEVPGVDVEDAGPGHGGRGGRPQVGDLEEKSHLGDQSDPLIAGQGEDLVVVHHGVEGLDPHGVNVPVQDNPLRPLLAEVAEVPHDAGEQAVLPLPGGGVDDPVQLVVGDGLGVEICVGRLLLQVLVSPEERLPSHSFSRASVPHDEDGVSDEQDLLQLDDLHDEILLWLQLEITGRVLHRLLKVQVSLPRNVQVGEEIRDEAEEYWHVVSNDFRNVEVSQSSHQHLLLGSVSVAPLESSGHHQDRLDCPQTPVVVVLLGQQLLAQIVQSDELPGQRAGVQESLSHQHDLAD